MTSVRSPATAGTVDGALIVPGGMIGTVTLTSGILQRFDYSTIEPSARALAECAADAIRLHQRRTVAEIIAIGAQLIAIKNAIRGKFGIWISAEFGWTERTAQRFMRAAEVFQSKSDTVSDLPPTAVYLLSGKSVPAEIVADIIDKLERGERVDLVEIRQKIDTVRCEKRKERLQKRRKVTRQRNKDDRAVYEQKRDREIEAANLIARGLFDELGASSVKRLLDALDSHYHVGEALRALVGEAQ